MIKLKWFSQKIGEVTLSLLFILLIYASYVYLYDNKAKQNQANPSTIKKDISIQAMSGELLLSMPNSYQSGKSLINADVRVYAFKTIKLSPELFSTPHSVWIRGDKLSGLSRDSLLLAASMMSANQVSWVPHYKHLLSSEWYVFPQYIEVKDSHPVEVKILMIKPQDNLLIYATIDTDSLLFQYMI